MSQIVIISFRLGGNDGVSIETAKWVRALSWMGYKVTTVAGSGLADRILPGLAIGALEPPTLFEIDSALSDSDLVIIENLCSLPLNPLASDLVAKSCKKRPTLLHHHDLAWQRDHLSHYPPPPNNPFWQHVTINELSRRELAQRSIDSTTIYNTFDPHPTLGDREQTRNLLGIEPEETLVLQPTRALKRKNIPGAIQVCKELNAVYWLLGEPEDNFDEELVKIVENAPCRVILGVQNLISEPLGVGSLDTRSLICDAYAACDVVALPSTWEGFGNPSVESATHLRPLSIGPYPVATELAAFGFKWFGLHETSELGNWLNHPDNELLRHNQSIAEKFFNVGDLGDRLNRVLSKFRLS